MMGIMKAVPGSAGVAVGQVKRLYLGFVADDGLLVLVVMDARHGATVTRPSGQVALSLT